MTTSLLKLAERCEGLTGPDRETECRVWLAATKPKLSYDVAFAGCKDLSLWQAPSYTASLDAAMTLAKGLERFGGPAGILREAMDRLHSAIQRTLPGTVTALDPTAYREALARFFVAASLRALAVEGGEG